MSLKMQKSYIVSANRKIDDMGDLSACESLIRQIENLGVFPAYLKIDPLNAGWDTPISANHFRSGCAPIEALAYACHLIGSGRAESVVISGEDNLKTGYERQERMRLTAIYGENHSLPEAYTDLARAFMKIWGISAEKFKQISNYLFENYQKTFGAKSPALPAKWFAPLTDLFRGVDCANPSVDFSGQLVICTKNLADACNIAKEKQIHVAGVGLGQTFDGPEHVDEIAKYDHLKSAYDAACKMAGIDFCKEYLNYQAFLEIYTCYPVVPMAFLLCTELVMSPDDFADFLKKYEITISGGMNLAKAPWNNPALNALILMYEKLVKGPHFLGAVHGNGGLGYKQGFAILKTEDHMQV